ncbi:unnamed protein product [Haemonchus placei]|uniref:Uncharacterized protein n=1 Tax=Haemonchus placei TaxID=6290 RepID=A0A3P7X616_HAEPC|nr:unnamed protein product [Haemonchus placei]
MRPHLQRAVTVAVDLLKRTSAFLTIVPPESTRLAHCYCYLHCDIVHEQRRCLSAVSETSIHHTDFFLGVQWPVDTISRM